MDQSITEELIEDRFGPDILCLFLEKRSSLEEGREVSGDRDTVLDEPDRPLEAQGAMASGGEGEMLNTGPVESLPTASNLVRAKSQQRLSSVEDEEGQMEHFRMDVAENLADVDANTEVAPAEDDVDGVAPAAASLTSGVAASVVVPGAAVGVGLMAGTSAPPGDGQFFVTGSTMATSSAGWSVAPVMHDAAVLPPMPAAVSTAAETSTEGREG